eukprot:11255384-Alexandrium_andersonii.AAC.1
MSARESSGALADRTCTRLLYGVERSHCTSGPRVRKGARGWRATGVTPHPLRPGRPALTSSSSAPTAPPC